MQHRLRNGITGTAPADQIMLTFGLAYKPIRQVIAKVDYSLFSNKADTGVNQLNFALGYLF